ncbi:hypothetical protein QUF90_19415 [Desulfococcaceae bacterium HSG9]|nr:hypothetical protein [Desulfococcaceae bacterium HSG9]
MRKLGFLCLFMTVVCALVAYSSEAVSAEDVSIAPVEPAAGCYRITKSYPLTEDVHGIDGVLQLLQDSRIPEDVYDKQLGSGFRDMYIYNEDLLRLFKDNPPLGSVLRILLKGKGYHILRESHTYDGVPLALLEDAVLSGGGRPTYLFTQDLSIGWGSYAGPMTIFYEVSNGKLKPLEYFDDKTKKKKRIAVMKSLKTDWKLVKTKDGKTTDILEVASRPANPEGEFVIYYDRFYFNGKQWVRYRRMEKGSWDMESDFPFSKFLSISKK